MHPTQVKAIQAKVYGGSARGTITQAITPTLNEVNLFLKEASYFLATSDARMLEIIMINEEGSKVLRNMYKAQRMEAIEDDPWTAYNVR